VEPQKPEQTGRAPELTVQLLRPPFWSGGFLFFTVIALVVALPIVVDLAAADVSAPVEELVAAAILLTLFGLAAAALIGYRLFVYLRPPPEIRFDAEHVTLPRAVDSSRRLTVRYADLQTVAIRGEPPRGALIVESEDQLLVYPFRAFRTPGDIGVVVSELNRRVGALPQAAAILESSERRQAFAEEVYERHIWATQVLIGLNVVMFLNQIATDAFFEFFGLIRWGARVPALVRDGEWFRIFAANFLHGSSFHIALNLFALYIVGGLLERLLGWVRFTAIYLLSGILAMLASTYLTNGLQSVGASGAVFGILGGLAIVDWRYHAELPMGFRQPWQRWAMILVLNAALPLSVPLVTYTHLDVWGHVVGFISGALLTVGLVDGEKRLRGVAKASPLLISVTGMLIVAYAWGLGNAVLYAKRFDSEVRAHVVAAALRGPPLDANDLNGIAWGLAVDPNVSDAGLAAARAAAERAVTAVPNESTFVDTLATVAYRSGKFDEAVRLERRVMEQPGAFAAAPSLVRTVVRFLYGGREQNWNEESINYATQLGRFLDAQVARDGALMDVGSTAPTLALIISDNGRVRLSLDMGEPRDVPTLLFATVHLGDEPNGLLRLWVAANTSRELLLLPDEIAGVLTSKRLTLSVGHVAKAPEVLSKAPSARVKYWQHDKTVGALP